MKMDKATQKEIESGNPDGGFENEGKGFSEWVVFRLTSHGSEPIAADPQHHTG